MKRPTLTYLYLCLLCTLCACTSIELCPETEHPHITDVRVHFNWGDANPENIPGELHVVASRIINTWRIHGIADSAKDPDTENNVSLEETSSDSPAQPSTREDEGTTETPVDTPPSFYLRGGEYNLFAINDLKTEITTEPAQTREETAEGTLDANALVGIENLSNYIHDKAVSANDLYLRVKDLGDKKPDIVEGNDLPDFNPNYKYLEEIKAPIFYAVKKGMEVRTGQSSIIDFDMQSISQHLNITFNIQTTGNIRKEDISEPIIELSGVCGRFNIAESCLDTTRLYRIAHKVAPEEFIQTSENSYRCTVHFNTLGVIPSASKSLLNGPGIIQIALQVSKEGEDGNGKNSRYIYAAINPYDELTAAQLIEIRDDKVYLRYGKDDVNIVIDTPLVIKADQIVPDDTGMGWQPHDPTNPDDDIIIEI